MPGSESLALLDPVHLEMGELRLNLFTAMPINDGGLVRAKGYGEAVDMFQQRKMSDAMQDLGYCRMHPRPLPGRKDNDFKAH
jgi:hypothetical protein